MRSVLFRKNMVKHGIMFLSITTYEVYLAVASHGHIQLRLTVIPLMNNR